MEMNMRCVSPENGVELKQRKIAPKVECKVALLYLSCLFHLVRSEAMHIK